MTTQHRFLTNEEWFNHFQNTLPLEVRERFEALLYKPEQFIDDDYEFRRLKSDLEDARDEVFDLEEDLRAANKKIDELQQKLDELEKSE